jgi:hypothetical protein
MEQTEDDGLQFDWLWTIGDTARYLRVTTQCVRNWERDLKLPVHMIGTTKRYIPAEVVAWLRSRCSDHVPGQVA